MIAVQIRHRLDGILQYMQPYWEFVNCHMVNYLTECHWQQFVPEELRSEVPTVQQARKCIELVFWGAADVGDGDIHRAATQSFPAFMTFLTASKEQRLQHFPEVLTTMEQLQHVFGKATESRTPLSIKEFMSDKKRHEVELTAELVDDLMRNHLAQQAEQELFVIDAGDGKGYFSSRLALQYGHKVLGIDCNAANTDNALERSRRLERAWKGLTERAELEQAGIKPTRRGRGKQKLTASKTEQQQQTQCSGNYKTTATYITTDLDLMRLLEAYFEPTAHTSPAFCLTGLHTCGNLASTCLQVFHAQSKCKILCNIGCCYHLLQEAYSPRTREYFGNKDMLNAAAGIGFPLSTYMHEKRVALGRNARMLAAQSIERVTASRELPNISLHYRALLELLIWEQNAQLKGTVLVGKVRKYTNFAEYLRLCCAKMPALNSELLLTPRIDDMEAQHADDLHYLNLFYLLRMSFAPVLESLILLDRLLYLKEMGYEHSYLVPLFDAVVSPRHFGIVAWK